MRSLRLSELLLLLSTVTACSTQPSTAHLAKELKTVKSWAATAHMVGDTWVQGSVPSAYARQTLQTAQTELQNESKTLAKVAPVGQRASALSTLHQLDQTVGQMAAIAAQHDKAAMSSHLEQLSIQEKAINQLIAASGEQP
jgi:hypothetical protein